MSVAEFTSKVRSFWKQPFFYFMVSFGLWDACLFFPSLQVAYQSAPGIGWNYLMVGWLGPVGGHFEWYANPALVISAYCLLKRLWPASILFSVIALMLMSILLFNRSILVDEGGGRHEITSFLVGYWLWVASAATLLLGAIIQMSQPRQVT